MKVFTLIICFFSLLFNEIVYSQTPQHNPPPVEQDAGWILVPSMSDEFDTLNNNKWNWQPPWGTVHGGDLGASEACLTNNTNNRMVVEQIIGQDTLRKLVLSVTDDQTTCEHDGTFYTKPYRVGGLFSYDSIQFGYFETRVKIPDSDIYETYGFGPNFWFWPTKPGYTGPYWWSEIDVFEFHADSNLQTSNIHCYREQQNGDTTFYRLRNIDFYQQIGGQTIGRNHDDQFVDFNNQWHTFACYWGPERISMYMDGQELTWTESEYCDSLRPMNMIFDINTPAVNFLGNSASVHPNADFPYHYEIDYVRAYQLQMDCSSGINLNSCAHNINDYDGSVKNYYIMSGSCGESISSGNDLFFKAVNYVQFDCELFVPFGTELNINTNIECY